MISEGPRASGMAISACNCPRSSKSSITAVPLTAGVAGVYQRHDFANEKKLGLARWGAHVADLVSGRRSRKVVRLWTRA